MLLRGGRKGECVCACMCRVGGGGEWRGGPTREASLSYSNDSGQVRGIVGSVLRLNTAVVALGRQADCGPTDRQANCGQGRK